MAKRTGRLTPAQVQRYLDGAGIRCPYCGSENLVAEAHFEADGDRAANEVSCLGCGATWRDVYVLSAIEILDEQDHYVATLEPGAETADLPIGNASRTPRVAEDTRLGGDGVEAGRVPDEERHVLTALVATIEATGGCVRDAQGSARPVADQDWMELAEVYLSACAVLGCTPRIVPEAGVNPER